MKAAISIYILPAPSIGRMKLKNNGHRITYPKKKILRNLFIPC
jgi:hypothetical protein